MTVHDAQIKVGRMRGFRWVLVVVVLLCFAVTPISMALAISASIKAGDAKTRVIAITRSACSLAQKNPADRVARDRCDQNIRSFVEALGPGATRALADKVRPYLR